MQCPIDGTALVMTDRSGVEIDYCPKCRGVWLDRGELDKIIERAAPAGPPVALNEPARRAAPQPGEMSRAAQPRFDDRRDDDRRDPRRRDDDDRSYSRKKRGGFLDDLFDF